METTNNARISYDEMKTVIREGEEAAKIRTEAEIKAKRRETSKPIGGPSRNFIVIGTGDGGCNIASDIKRKVPGAYSIIYNTSRRAINTLAADTTVIPKAEDGSGKDRAYSKEVFRKSSYQTLLAIVQKAMEAGNFEYVMVTTTADGGTGGGSSPNVAKVIADNINKPVIILGVYPALAEDAKAQYNTLAWQADIEKTGLPFIIYDNNERASSPKVVMQNLINEEIAEAMTVLAGQAYGDTNISSIDNQDMHMMLVEAGKRITVMTTDSKPKVGETLDEFLITKMQASGCLEPNGPSAIGLFVKGPKSFLNSTDTSMFAFREHYGEAMLYTHLEESDKVKISVITAGNGFPEERLEQIRERYDDIVNNVRKTEKTAASVLEGLDDPFKVTKVVNPNIAGESNFSGLDL